MKNLPGGICLSAALAVALMAAPLYGTNRSVLPKRAVAQSRYNFSKEVTLKGTIQRIDAKPSAAMMFGAHLTVATSEGTVEAQVGRFLLRGPGAASFAPGQQVQLVGLMTTLNHHQVLLTRLIVTGGRTITVRNQNGFAVSPSWNARHASASTTGGAR